MHADLDRFLARASELSGIDLSGYCRTLIDRCIAERMRRLAISDAAAYLCALSTDPAECDRLIDLLGINYSSFFRDPLVFGSIRHRVLPDIMERKRHGGSREIRVWSAGCGSGEEAYSVAILLRQVIDGDHDEWTPRIFATDIDRRALAAADAARFPRASFRTTQLGVIDAYLAPSDSGFRVRNVVKDMVRFSRHDLTSPRTAVPPDSVFGTFDLVLCRNVLMYFSPRLQHDVLDRLGRAVVQGGYLVLGESDTLVGTATSILHTVDHDRKIFRKSPG